MQIIWEKPQQSYKTQIWETGPIIPSRSHYPKWKRSFFKVRIGWLSPLLLPQISEASTFLALEGPEYEWHTNLNLKLEALIRVDLPKNILQLPDQILNHQLKNRKL